MWCGKKIRYATRTYRLLLSLVYALGHPKCLEVLIMENRVYEAERETAKLKVSALQTANHITFTNANVLFWYF